MFPATTTGSSIALAEAVRFLAKPLLQSFPLLTVHSLQQVLLSTLANLPTWHRNGRLILTLSSATPPRPVYATCIATNIDWNVWFNLLGGSEFDLVIERTIIIYQAFDKAEPVIIWKQSSPTNPIFASAIPRREQVPISKFSQSAQLIKASSTPSTLFNSFVPAPRPKTFAQQLLQSEQENEEADEMFAMISNLNACLISPTPTRECFVAPRPTITRETSRLPYLTPLEEEIFHSRSSFRQAMFTDNDISPVSSPESSRPGSPSSISSHFSRESFTSMSSTSSPTTSPSSSTNSLSPIHGSSITHSLSVPDSTKTQVQRYLYQGGQSNVLTGGVMLGSVPKPSPPIYHSTTLKNRSPILGGKSASSFGWARPQQSRAGSGSGSWRRPTTFRRRSLE